MPENLDTHYHILCETFLQCNFTVVNPDYDPEWLWTDDNPTDVQCQPIFIKPKHMWRIWSFNETEATTDMSQGSRGNASCL